MDLNEKKRNHSPNGQEQTDGKDNGCDWPELSLSQHWYQHLECCLNSLS